MAKLKQRKNINDLLGEALEVPSNPAEAVSAGVVKIGAAPKPVKSSTVNTSLYLPRAVLKQVKELAATEDVKPHDLYLESLDLLFKKRGLKSISEITTS